MARILITGGRAPAALELSRQFHEAGHIVFVADSVPWMLSASSRAVSGSFRLPEPRNRPGDFAAEIGRIIQAQEIEIVIPTCEEVFYVGQFRDRLGGAARIFCPDIDILRRLHSKWEFARFIDEQEGFGTTVRSPQSWLLGDPGQIGSLPVPAGDLVFKPVYSRFGVETLIRPRHESAMAADISAGRPWVAQRWVTGRELCSYSVCSNGVVRAHALYQPTWRAGKSAGIFFEPQSVPEIERFVEGIARHLNLTGQIAFDFIEDGTGGISVLECNPRATSGVHLFGPELADAFIGDAGVGITGVPPLPRMVAFAMILFGVPSILRGNSLSGETGRFWRDFRRAQDVLWSWRDPVPALYSLLGAGSFAWRGWRKGVSVTAATTIDIQWDGGIDRMKPDIAHPALLPDNDGLTEAESRRHERRMDRKYRFSRHIFDLSRRFFLFGRDRAIANLRLGGVPYVLEVGCGTGRNLRQMTRLWPETSFVGVEISSEMLKTARVNIARAGLDGRTALLHGDAARLPPLPVPGGRVGCILMSYVLSMVPDWRRALDAAIDVLEVGGILSIVDFGNFGGLPGPAARLCIGSLSRHDAPPCLSLPDELKSRADAGLIKYRHEYRLAGFYQIAIIERLPNVE